MELTVSSLSDLDLNIASQVRSDYIYMYPPRQAYRFFDPATAMIKDKVAKSIRHRGNLNIYIHVPFCRQICGFCNLYTTNIKSPEVHDAYVAAVLTQIAGVQEFLSNHIVPTIYFGGGTPTVLARHTLKRLIDGVLSAFPDRTKSCEVAIEVDPQTVTPGDLEFMRTLGINRINLGLQTRNNAELKTIGRRYRSLEQWQLAYDAMSTGFQNVCIDLIYGLPIQTADSWKKSVMECIEFSPQTICCYPLTERPHTGFAKSSRMRSSDSDYDMWEFADKELRSAGYERQSHVRWAREGGGYMQKELHWGLENLFGFGAGARSYLWDIDLRMNYSIAQRRRALDLYMESINRGELIPQEGIVMCTDERLRKAVILGIHKLDADKVLSSVGIDPIESFGAVFDGLSERGLLTTQGRTVALTQTGMKYRDLIVQMFFSERVRQLTTEFSYNE